MDQDLYPAQCVHISLDSQFLDVARLVAVDPEITVGELALITHAALGLEPAPPGHFHVGERQMEILDVLDEPAFDTLFGADDFADYHPSVGNWDIQLMRLSPTRVGQATPALIDATGPDLLSAVGDANPMRAMLEDVRQLLSGIPIPQPKWEAIRAIFPNYSLDQVRMRLTECFHPAIVERLRELGSVEDTMPAGFDMDMPFTPQVPAPFEQAIGVREIVLDTFPELELDHPLPQLSDASGRTLGEHLGALLRLITEDPRLTSTGAFPPALVARLVDACDVSSFWPGMLTNAREAQVFPVHELHEFLRSSTLLSHSTTRLSLTPLAEGILREPELATQIYFDLLPFCDDDAELVSTALLFSLLVRGEEMPVAALSGPASLPGPDNLHRTVRLYQMLGIIAPEEPLRLTEAGRGMVGWQLDNLRRIIEVKAMLSDDSDLTSIFGPEDCDDEFGFPDSPDFD